MSYKIDTILEKASVYEKLAIYGNRKDYLRALAQASLPDVNSLAATVDATRKNILTSLTQFWTQNPDSFPMAARIAYSALRYPQNDITTAAGEQVSSAMDQLSAALTAVYSALMAGNQKGQDFAQQTVYPALDKLQQQITQYRDAIDSVPQIPEEDDGAGTLNVPEQTLVGQPMLSIDPDTLADIQAFLNQQTPSPVPPLVLDGKWGPLTARALQQWGKANKLPAHNMQQLIDAAKARVVGKT